MSCVLPGLPEVFARLFRRMSILMRDDLPTLLRPIKAYSGMPFMGHLETSLLLTINSADLIFNILAFRCVAVFGSQIDFGYAVKIQISRSRAFAATRTGFR